MKSSDALASVELAQPSTFPSIVDSTMLSDVGLCHRKVYWAWFRHKVPALGSIHLVAGGAYARGLEVARKLYYSRDSAYYPDKIQNAMPAAWRAAVSAWDGFQAPEKSPKQLWRVLEAIDYYFRAWPPGTDHLQPYELAPGRPAIEFTFAFPLPDCFHPETGDPILYAGRIDEIATLDNQLFVLDDKTASELGPAWPQKWDLRGQFLGYMHAVDQMLHLKLAGVAVRAMCFRKHGYETAEKLIFFQPWQVEEWLEATVQKVQGLIEAYKRNRFVKAYGEPCAMYGGCNYRTLCTKREPELWLEPDYVDYEWSPITLTTHLSKPQEAA